MKGRLINFYIFLYSKEKFIGPINGFVFGYAISILQEQDKTDWHKMSLISGIIFSMFCSLLLLIANGFNDHLSKMKANLPEDTDADVEYKTWIGINKAGKKKTRIIGLPPRKSTPIFTFVMVVSLFFGIFSLCKGNIESGIEQSSKEINVTKIKKDYNSNLLRLTKQLNGESFTKLNDTIKVLRIELGIQKRQLDSLRRLMLSPRIESKVLGQGIK